MGGLIFKENGKWLFIDESGKKKPLPDSIARDLSSKDKNYAYKYYDVVENSSKEVERARWGDHPFGKYAIQTTSNKKTPSPELIHSSGTLIMEERQIISDIIKVLSAPFDDIEDCVSFSENFDLYKTCYDFIKDPNNRSDLLSQFDSASYKLYYSIPLTSLEASLLKEDSLIAEKVLRGESLSLQDKKILLKENIAVSKNGKFSVNRQKILGIHYDTYRYVVAIEKNAHHYEVLKNNWESLSKLRRAMLEDFNNFAIKDPEVFYSFVKELMLMRDDLKRISRKEVLEILEKTIN